jgi:LCP family protein required for cell wall assembly
MSNVMDIENRINFLRPQPLTPAPEPRRPKKAGLFFIFLLIAFFLIGYAYRQYTLNEWPKEANSYDPITLKPKKAGIFQSVKNFVFHSDNLLAGQNEDRVNILLLGMGGAGHDGPYLTDTNIILSVQPSTKQIAMISVPRDLGVNINGDIRKINYADAYGEANNPGSGGEYARQIFEKTFKISVPYYVRVDFKAFEELIDEVGGITVNVPRAFTDSQFPGDNHSYQTIIFEAGNQTMNGGRALQYARSRHGNNGEGSDFARSRRQQQILTALKERLLSFGTYTNPIRIQNILQTLSEHITTNLDFGQLMYLANLGREANEGIKMLVLDNGTNGFLNSYIAPSGAFILSPTIGNFDNINLAIKNVFNSETAQAQTAPPTPTENQSIFPSAKIEIQNGTWIPGLAALAQKKLEDKGFTVLAPSNSAKRPWDKTYIYILKNNLAPEIKTAIVSELNAETKDGLPSWLPLASTTTPSETENIGYNKEADVLIILGTDTKQ